jgi:hypothetical protein
MLLQPARTDLELDYQVFVNGITLDTGVIDGASGRRQLYIPSDFTIFPDDIVDYIFTWRSKSFNIPYVSASDTFFVTGANQPITPTYDDNFDNDGHGYTNKREIDEKYAPLSSLDGPVFPLTPNDARRETIRRLSWTVPVFGCTNRTDATWYWILETNNTVSGIDSPDSYARNRAEWEFIDGGTSRIRITNISNRTDFSEWTRTANDAALIVDGDWGDCVRIAGPRL